MPIYIARELLDDRTNDLWIWLGLAGADWWSEGVKTYTSGSASGKGLWDRNVSMRPRSNYAIQLGNEMRTWNTHLEKSRALMEVVGGICEGCVPSLERIVQVAAKMKEGKYYPAGLSVLVNKIACPPR